MTFAGKIAHTHNNEKKTD